MNFIKTIFQNVGSRIWFIVTVTLLILLLVVSIVLTAVIPGLMDTIFGGERSSRSGGTDYYTASEGITDKATSLAAANALNTKICEEGFILLKNGAIANDTSDDILPLTTAVNNKLKISVFGKNSVNLAYGSSGSVGGSTDKAKSIFDSLEEANFSYNTTLKAFYEDTTKSGPLRPTTPSMSSGKIVAGFATGETPVIDYPQDVKDSFADHDTALVVITRTSGENSDLPTTMKETTGAYSDSDHYLELDKNEQDMLQMACENFTKVILVLNSGTPIELGFLDGNNGGDTTVNNYDYADKVKAAIWIGLPGETGIMALGRILNGDVNPSGKTVDTYARDFMSIPAVKNFSVKGEANVDNYVVGTKVQDQWFIDYEEGIYVGYRYFETRGSSGIVGGDGETWYNNNVVYPFGYGLSYTTFSKTAVQPSVTAISKETEIEFTVNVKNTGDKAGKEVVQLYVTPPYSAALEKSHKVLVGYAKTGLLEPGAEIPVTIKVDPYYFATYNESGNGCYVLNAGDYVFSISSDAHTADDTVTMNLPQEIKYESDPETGYEVKNRFQDIDDQLDTGKLLSRINNWSNFPEMRTDAEKIVSQEFITDLEKNFESGNPLTSTSKIVTDTNAKRSPATVKSKDGMMLYEVMETDYDDAEWDKLLSRITISSIWDTLSSAAFNTASVDYIGKPRTIDTDGPAGFTKFIGETGQIYDTCFYCSQVNVAATWSDELAYAMGESIGNEGLIGNRSSSDPAQWTTYSGWYAPGVNLHRTPFGGRNPEYYSEDSYLSGSLASQVIKGAATKGVYTYVKHFAANEQETHRGGVCTWMTEQTYRELYLKPFEMTVKMGKTTAMMSSFNRVGTRWTGGDYRLMTEVLRNEWGFEGMVICDFASNQSHMNFKQQVYAGADLWLDTIMPSKWYDSKNALDVYVMQESMKRVLYTVVNSNAMNGLGEGAVYETYMAYWRIVLIIVVCVVPVCLAVWGFFAIRNVYKKKAEIQNN